MFDKKTLEQDAKDNLEWALKEKDRVECAIKTYQWNVSQHQNLCL